MLTLRIGQRQARLAQHPRTRLMVPRWRALEVQRDTVTQLRQLPKGPHARGILFRNAVSNRAVELPLPRLPQVPAGPSLCQFGDRLLPSDDVVQRAKRAGLFLCPLLLVGSRLQPTLPCGLQAQILLAKL